jgi:hypothetical protein
MNRFGDLTPDEFASRFGSGSLYVHFSRTVVPPVAALHAQELYVYIFYAGAFERFSNDASVNAERRSQRMPRLPKL